jgi:toluene monooxygenase system ferredoxin subunit
VSFCPAATVDDVWEGEMVRATVNGIPVLLVHTCGELSAFLDRCAHQGVALSEGRLDGGVIVCRAHGWRYDARSGQGINPSSACLKRYPVRIEGSAILVDVSDEGARAP